MSSGRDDQGERFADGWARHGRRSQAGRGGPSGPELDLTDFDAADMDLAAALREAARTVPGPDHAASARMRAGLMDAITGGAAEEQETAEGRVLTGRPATAGLDARRPGSAGSRGAGRADRSRQNRPGDDRPAGAPSRGRAPQRRGRSRVMANALAGFCAVLVLGALTVVIGRGALPGQMLYGVKRASESVEMGLTSGPEARGQKNLDFAANRLDEISGLIEKDSATAAGTGPAAAGLDPATAALVAENLVSFDQNARTGSKLLLPLMSQTGGPQPGLLADWARQQSTHLGSISPSLPPSQQASVSDSRRLMDRLGSRAAAVDGRTTCSQAASGDEDEFGPVPAACGGTERSVAAPSPSTTTSTTGKKTTTRSTTEDTTSSEDSSRSTTGGSTTTTSERSSSRELLPQVPVQLPTPSVKAPVNVPLPVPGLPPVSVPPLVPGLPGLNLG